MVVVVLGGGGGVVVVGGGCGSGKGKRLELDNSAEVFFVVVTR